MRLYLGLGMKMGFVKRLQIGEILITPEIRRKSRHLARSDGFIAVALANPG